MIASTALGRTPGSFVPVLTVIGALFLDLLPLPDAAPRSLAPSLLLCALYFWTVYRPDLLPTVALFALGGMLDAGSGMPLGVTSVALLLARALLMAGRRWLAVQPLLIAWACFLPAAMVVTALRWALLSLLLGRTVPLEPVLIETGLTFAAYPIVAGILGVLQRRASVSSRAAGS